MEDTKSLLIMVLHKIFHDRPKIVENTYQLIYNYNNGKREKNEYEKTLKSICDLMNDEVPSEILVYLLTLVDMPQQDGSKLPIMEKIQKTYSCLNESVRPCLLEYISKKKCDEKSTPVIQKEDIPKEHISVVDISTLQEVKVPEPKVIPTPSARSPDKKDEVEENFVKPVVKKPRTRRRGGRASSSRCTDDCNDIVKPLLDIVACYVIRNERKLKQYYKSKLQQAWRLINSNRYHAEPFKGCYNAVRDFNKKLKLLRCIENDNITEDVMMEEYGNSEILARDYTPPVRDPFEVTDVFVKEINDFIHN